ncbi:hypothetical protein ABT391_10820 [Streptomyces jumonjinensis]|uniref:hypothetical protein n=1 Tax=Streptomyces jumonjinensis TaxID=1945 RepID=UPI00332219EC
MRRPGEEGGAAESQSGAEWRARSAPTLYLSRLGRVVPGRSGGLALLVCGRGLAVTPVAGVGNRRRGHHAGGYGATDLVTLTPAQHQHPEAGLKQVKENGMIT